MVEISVIMGIYNCSSTLQEALNSLYRQTFKKIEIILCDDGSVDNTYQIALENAKIHDNIILLQNETNQGLNYTLNRCLSVAKGKYIARMDGDDISLPSRFEKEYNFLENHPEYSIVSSAMKYFNENGVFRVDRYDKPEPSIEDFVKHTPFNHAPCMVRKEAYEAVGGYSEAKKLLRVEDYHLWMKMYLKGYKGFRIDEPLYMMRDDNNAIKRRAFIYRINESYVKYLICRNFSLPIWSYIWCLRPIIIGLMPLCIYKKIRSLKNA